MITKGERTELRSIVRQQFKVLRAEIKQREHELFAEAEEEITAAKAKEDKAWSDATFEIEQAVLTCNREINDILHKHGFQAREGRERMWVDTPRMGNPMETEKMNLRRRAHARILERVAGALLRLDREEADLLRTLATGAIESEAAREFLAGIPTVGELVPAARLLELMPTVLDEDEEDQS